MHSVAGYLWPDQDTSASYTIPVEAKAAIPWFLSHVEGRDTIVQAGANVGVYPIALARHFKRILTVEPDPLNYGCFMQNMLEHSGSTDRIFRRQAAFGEALAVCKPVIAENNNYGANRIALDDTGIIPVVTIDSMAGNALVDAIWLDIEGYELPALKGALETIKRCKPVIAVEEKGLGKHFGIQPGELEDFLFQWGYSRRDKHGNDFLYKADL